MDALALNKNCAFRIEIYNQSHALRTTRGEIKRVLEVCRQLSRRDNHVKEHRLFCSITELWAIFYVDTWTYTERGYQ